MLLVLILWLTVNGGEFANSYKVNRLSILIELLLTPSYLYSILRKTNIFDNVVYMMEKYADNLEDLVSDRTAQLLEEKKKTDALLDRILPRYTVLQ